MTSRDQIIREKEEWVARYRATTICDKELADDLVRVIADRAVTLGQIGTMSALDLTRALQKRSLLLATRPNHQHIDIVTSLPRTLADIAVLKMKDALPGASTVSARELEALRRDSLELRPR